MHRRWSARSAPPDAATAVLLRLEVAGPHRPPARPALRGPADRRGRLHRLPLLLGGVRARPTRCSSCTSSGSTTARCRCYLADVVEPGDELELRGPIGGWFVWDGDVPRVGVAGGTGVVPLVAMLRHARDLGRRTCSACWSRPAPWPSCPTPTSSPARASCSPARRTATGRPGTLAADDLAPLVTRPPPQPLRVRVGRVRRERRRPARRPRRDPSDRTRGAVRADGVTIGGRWSGPVPRRH